MTNQQSRISYAITQFGDKMWLCEYLIDGHRNKECYGTGGRGYKVFPLKERAEMSGKRYVKKWREKVENE